MIFSKNDIVRVREIPRWFEFLEEKKVDHASGIIVPEAVLVVLNSPKEWTPGGFKALVMTSSGTIGHVILYVKVDEVL